MDKEKIVDNLMDESIERMSCNMPRVYMDIIDKIENKATKAAILREITVYVVLVGDSSGFGVSSANGDFADSLKRKHMTAGEKDKPAIAELIIMIGGRY